MSALRRLQKDFQCYLLRPTPDMESAVLDTDRASARVRLGVYADAYRLRLLEALQIDYPALHSLVGDETFDRLGRAYIDAHPSRHFSIRWFGQNLAAFLRHSPPYCDFPVAAEMADFEWAMTLAFDAADATPLSLAAMAEIPPSAWADMRLLPQASVQRLNLEWNVPVFWKAIDAGETPDAPPSRAPYPVGWVVWRHELMTYFRSIEVDEAFALDALCAGQTFAQICEGLCEWIDPQHAAAHAAGMLKQWVSDGMLRGVTLNDH